MSFSSRPISSTSSMPVALISAGSVGNAMQEGVELFLGDGADGDEVVAEPAAVLGQALERLGNVAFGDQLGANQQIS